MKKKKNNNSFVREAIVPTVIIALFATRRVMIYLPLQMQNTRLVMRTWKF